MFYDKKFLSIEFPWAENLTFAINATFGFWTYQKTANIVSTNKYSEGLIWQQIVEIQCDRPKLIEDWGVS